MDNFYPLTSWQKWGLLLLSFVVVAFGQPAWSEWLGLIAAFGGFACFWRVLLSIPNAKNRFFLGMGWFGAIQCVQLSWFFSHPYLYIYAVVLFCALWLGAGWGLIALWIRPAVFRRISLLLALAGLWVLLEWSRLFLLSGLPFNPVGLALTSSLYPLQLASIGGVYGLSFFVMITNLLLLRAWISPFSPLRWGAFWCAALFPYLFGSGHLSLHEQNIAQNSPQTINTILVQSALPIEENISFQSADEARQFVLNEWHRVLSTLQKRDKEAVELIVLPEYLVPYGTFHPVYLVEEVQDLFREIFGDVFKQFPSYDSPYVEIFKSEKGVKLLVSNAYLSQTLANLFEAHVVVGLEDSSYVNGEKVESFSSAFHFIPWSTRLPGRYDKQILVPMGEYIPFAWCRSLAARYGVTGSFTCGKGAKVFPGPVPFGVSICYEEMYGHLIRDNRVQGAELLVNVTNDGWYPGSLLPKQHFDHARLRTVENGIPSVRACNTGVTGAVDSLGRVVGIFGTDSIKDQELRGALQVDVPLYHYRTFYSQHGDIPIIAFSIFCVFFGFIHSRSD